MEEDITKMKCALIVAHPGHELRVYGWLRKSYPAIVILTDGSGHNDKSRIQLTKNLLGNKGLYGLFSDRAIYEAILDQNIPFFLSLADHIADFLVNENVDYVTGDAIEGYNPTHDICRLLIDRSVKIAGYRLNRFIYNYAFPLVGPPRSEKLSSTYWVFNFEQQLLSEKLAEIKHYAQSAGGILVSEVDDMLQTFGEAAFAEEVFYSINSAESLLFFENQKPFYEIHGEKQVAAGHYKNVIRYKEHIAPIAQALTTT